MKKYFIIVLLIALLLTACSQQKAKETESTKDTAAPTANITAETEEATAVPPTVADDLNYYEMYQKEAKRSEDVGNGEFFTTGNEYAKEWKSTDGKISFILDAKYGPFGYTKTHAKYYIDGKAYNTEISFDVNVRFEMTASTENKYTIILSGPFEYDHDEQSFTVTSGSEIFSVPFLSESESIESFTVEKWNSKYGDPSIPCYQKGEKVTFKMVRQYSHLKQKAPLFEVLFFMWLPLVKGAVVRHAYRATEGLYKRNEVTNCFILCLNDLDSVKKRLD